MAIFWRKWISCLENLFVAMNIGDVKRQRALLLHYALQKIFQFLPKFIRLPPQKRLPPNFFGCSYCRVALVGTTEHYWVYCSFGVDCTIFLSYFQPKS